MNENERVKKIRKEENLSQSEFGSRLGISRDGIANIEGNRVELKEQTIKLICKEFNVNEEWLRSGKGTMFNEDIESELMKWVGRVLAGSSQSIQKRILTILMALDDADWEMLDAKIKKALEKIKKS